MRTLLHNTITRRNLLAGVFASWTILRTNEARASQLERPTPVDLGHGLEIRDYRLFPTADVMRFIVEIHNTTDAAVDTPSVGVVLPHLEGENFGWANPVAGVIHPHTSQGLIGVAPAALTSDQDWGSPDWVLCNDLQTEAADVLAEWDVEVAWDFRVRGEADAVSRLTVTNLGTTSTEPASLQGLVWDDEGRLCGATNNVLIAAVPAGETLETWGHVWSIYEYVASPFALIDNIEGIDVSYSIQPRPASINPACPAVLPWE